MQQYGRLVIKNSVLDSLVCSWDSLILDVASPRTHKPKIVNESLDWDIKPQHKTIRNLYPNLPQNVDLQYSGFISCNLGLTLVLKNK